MDDIQFWIYVLFGLIYVITRALRKKQPEEPMPPTEESGESRPRRREPKSFEELLREFTEAGSTEEEPAEEVIDTRPATPAYESSSRKVSSASDLAGEGETRHFADDESRKIYEASIRQAEASPITYERDEHFKISRGNLRSPKTGVRTSPVAKEVREILSSPTSARKAIILAEILNRKY